MNFTFLPQAHICILGNRMDEAKWLLESYNYNRFAIGKDVELSSYYLYLTTKLSNDSIRAEKGRRRTFTFFYEASGQLADSL